MAAVEEAMTIAANAFEMIQERYGSKAEYMGAIRKREQ